MFLIIMSYGYNNLKGPIGTIDSCQNIPKCVANYINYRKRFTQCRFHGIGSYCWKGCDGFLIVNELSGKKLHKGWDCFPSSDPGKPSRPNIWIMSASSRDLEEDTGTGKFRQDLLCRLSTRKIVIEPLRRRPEDIPSLVHHFMQEYADCLNVGTLKGPKRKTIRRMVEYHWPGNVKELQSVLKRMMIF